MEVNEACSIIQDAAHEDANIIFGAVINENCGDEIRVTVIATGFPAEYEEKDLRGEQNLFQGTRRAAPRQAFSQRYDTGSRIIVPQPKTIVAPHNPFAGQAPRREMESAPQPSCATNGCSNGSSCKFCCRSSHGRRARTCCGTRCFRGCRTSR